MGNLVHTHTTVTGSNTRALWGMMVINIVSQEHTKWQSFNKKAKICYIIILHYAAPGSASLKNSHSPSLHSESVC